MKVTLLGTGSPIASERRASTGHLVETGNARIIVDFGPGACRRLLQSGRRPTEITHIFLTHLHFDHIGDLATLLFYIWEENGGLRPLPPVRGPVGTRRLVERLFGEDGAYAPDIHARTHMPESLDIYENRGGILPRPRPAFQVEEFSDAGWTEEDGLRIGRFPVIHAQPYLDSFGYRIEADGATLAISSDVAITEPSYATRLEPLAEDAGILIHYMNHLAFEPEERKLRKQALVAELASRLRVRHLVTTHHGPKMDAAGVGEAVVADIARRFPGAVTWGEDLLSFDVPSRTD